MTLALLDCPTGLAGNMLLAALLDLGVPPAVVHAPLADLGLGGTYALEISERRSGGLRGLHLEVVDQDADPPARTWQSLRRTLLAAPWPEALRARVLSVFELLAEAEASVHGHAPEQVHFHEVGALDALVDVVGVCAALLHLGISRLECTPPPAGHGTVATAHGLLPLPAPAVLEIARCHGIPLASAAGFPAGELTTPTGLALMAAWAENFGLPPAHRPRQVGIGLGSRQLDRPNLLRLVLADPVEGPGASPGPSQGEQELGPAVETVLEQQAQIDDATPEDLAVLQEALRQAGALEVFCTPIQMKKGRPGWLVTALAHPVMAVSLRGVWWQHSTSLGLRERSQPRWVLPRRQRLLPTPLGEVPIKQALLPDGRWRSKPEHDALVGLARSHNLSIEQVRAVVEEALRSQCDQGQPGAIEEAR
ncbi:LarC family nickel insertion protein [Cyanobium sp. NS01]|uniref:LarC family nickel insertion protein n=1 Tax=Cyanobium sp. NS01 TaxID=261284 RepID=UPI0016493896|nr:LarC family nickel insertion protein [Cyanobium sp. NS01]QNI70047.1 putative pyridinium-3/5-bisthiocarboxylic acid mononucleotide nickel chelatase [Cyanobium sp. NS01]